MVVEEVSHHVEGPFWLIGRDHVPCMVHKNEPEIVIDFDPTSILPVNCPDLFEGSLPVRQVDPVQSVYVVQDSGSVNYKIVLTVVNQNPDILLEEGDNISCIASSDIFSKGVVNVVISRHVVGV